MTGSSPNLSTYGLSSLMAALNSYTFDKKLIYALFKIENNENNKKKQL
jgi:hypothetical protein